MLQGESKKSGSSELTADRDHDRRLVHSQLQTIARKRRKLDVQEAFLLGRAEDVEVWRIFGHVTLVEYMERVLEYKPRTAQERIRVARALRELPKIRAALESSSIVYSTARELTRVATPVTEQKWLNRTRGLSARAIEELVAGHKYGDLPTDPVDPNRPRKLTLDLGPQTYAMLRQVQTRLAVECGHRLSDDEVIEILCRRAFESNEGAVTKPAFQMSITTCRACKRSWQDGAGTEVELDRSAVDRAACDAEHLGASDSDTPARVTRSVTSRTRRQVFARDHHRCRVPDCRSARNLDIHHVVRPEDGGTHSPSNLILLCSGHSKHLQDGRLVIRGTAPGELSFTRPVDSDEGPRVGPPVGADAHQTPSGQHLRPIRRKPARRARRRSQRRG